MIIFDLDGPILDVSEKYYRVYSDILINNDDSPLSKDEYWSLKRSKTSNKIILNKSNAKININQFFSEWKKNIELSEYIVYDKIQNGAYTILQNLSQQLELVLITLRSSKENLIVELENLKLIEYFSYIYTPEFEITPRWKMKKDLIDKYLSDKIGNNCLMVGDTETDVIAGKNAGIITISITNGIRNPDIIINENPTHIFPNIQKFYLWFINENR